MHFNQEPVLVSILIAARNEEANIKRCLLSLDALDYPVGKLEIWIGDDDSTDRTAEIVQEFIRDKSQFRYFRISETVAGLKGKSNVLAQLAGKAKGEYFLFCDADITVQPEWAKTLLRHFTGKTGVVVGLTRMKKSNWFADFLSLEWLFILSIMRFLSLFRIPMTGLGNNMAVTREAYEAVGGYEKIGFSIVEDYALFKAVIQKKYEFKQAFTKDAVAYSEPVTSIKELIAQRKRWMHGIMQSPLTLKICVIASALYIPVMAVLYIWDPHQSISSVVSHYALITGITLLSLIILKQTDLLKGVVFFWFYLMAICLAMLVIYMLPGKTVWKEREY